MKPYFAAFALSSAATLCASFALFAPTLRADEPTPPSLPFVDYHYHVFEEKATPETALATQRATGIRRGVLENVGRDSIWVLHTSADVERFIDEVSATDALLRPGEPRLLVGLQVNDRDWFQRLDPKVYRRLDFILADAMYYTDKTGKQFGLWEYKKDEKIDVDAWFAEYYEYNLRLLDEPIDVFANPTYLPAFAEDEYDRLWTEVRCRALIQKAIDGNIALEIQAQSNFPSKRFIALAREMGAKFAFGTNNFDGNPVDVSRWEATIREFKLTEDDLWKPRRR